MGRGRVGRSEYFFGELERRVQVRKGFILSVVSLKDGLDFVLGCLNLE